MLALKTKGEAYERGRQRGAAFARQSRALLRRFCGSIDRSSRNEHEKLQQIEQNMREVCPEILEEIKGVAAGAGLPYEDILLLNCAVELGAIDKLARCSNLALTTPAFGAIHGMNHDIDPTDAHLYTAIEYSTSTDGIMVKRITWTGTVWTDVAMNNREC